MAVADDHGPPAGPEHTPGTPQLDVDGEAVLTYTVSRQERPTADDAVALARLDVTVPAVLDQLAGWWLTSSDESLIDALLSAGATMVRHAHLYSRPLQRTDAARAGAAMEPLPAGLRWSPIDRPPSELARLVVLAYPPGHVDHQGLDPKVEEPELIALLAGEIIGPFLTEASALVIDDPADTDRADRAGGIVAGIIVNRGPGPPPAGGPWVSQVFRHPDPAYAGLGVRALRRSLAILAAAGEPALSLAVTDGNPARQVYERLGFQLVSSRRKLAIPE